MRSRNLKIVLKEDAKEIFNPMEEKNKFLKRLYKENITPPKKLFVNLFFQFFKKIILTILLIMVFLLLYL